MNKQRWTGFKFRNRRYKGVGGRSTLAPVFTALAITLIKDLTSGKSKLLNVARNLLSHGSAGKEKPEKQILDADYNVLEEETDLEN